MNGRVWRTMMGYRAYCRSCRWKDGPYAFRFDASSALDTHSASEHRGEWVRAVDSRDWDAAAMLTSGALPLRPDPDFNIATHRPLGPQDQPVPDVTEPLKW